MEIDRHEVTKIRQLESELDSLYREHDEILEYLDDLLERGWSDDASDKKIRLEEIRNLITKLEYELDELDEDEFYD